VQAPEFVHDDSADFTFLSIRPDNEDLKSAEFVYLTIQWMDGTRMTTQVSITEWSWLLRNNTKRVKCWTKGGR
jgi:hypothetical protein